jgi:hypothetical protein
MRFTVIGTGSVGRTITTKLDSLGHEVALGTRDPEATLTRSDNGQTIEDWLRQLEGVQLRPINEAAKFGEVVVNATSGTASVAALETAGAENLARKVIIDVSNPLDFSNGMPPSLDPVNTDSLGERIQRTFPDAHVVKALNTMNAPIMVDPSSVSGDHNVFVSGNDGEAKSFVRQLLAEFGWPERNIVDLGDITSARGAEMLLPIWLRLAGTIGHFNFNFHVQGAY